MNVWNFTASTPASAASTHFLCKREISFVVVANFRHHENLGCEIYVSDSHKNT